MRRLMIGIRAEATGQTIEGVTADIDRDYILRGEPQSYGVVDHEVEPTHRRRPLELPQPIAVLEAAPA